MSKLLELEQKQKTLNSRCLEYGNTRNTIQGLKNRMDYLLRKLRNDLKRPLGANVSILNRHIETMQFEICRDRLFLQNKYNDCKNLLDNEADIEQKILLQIELKKIDKSIELQEVALQQKKKNMQLKILERDNIISAYNENFERIYTEIYEISGKTKNEILKEFESEDSMQKDIEKIEKEACEAVTQAVAKIEREKESKKNRLLKIFRRVV